MHGLIIYKFLLFFHLILYNHINFERQITFLWWQKHFEAEVWRTLIQLSYTQSTQYDIINNYSLASMIPLHRQLFLQWNYPQYKFNWAKLHPWNKCLWISDNPYIFILLRKLVIPRHFVDNLSHAYHLPLVVKDRHT